MYFPTASEALRSVRLGFQPKNTLAFVTHS